MTDLAAGDGALARGRALRLNGRAAEALPLLERYRAARPDDVVAHTELVATLLALDRPGDAVVAGSRALAVAPTDPVAHLSHGRALLRAGKARAAVAAAGACVSLAPDFAAGHDLLAAAQLARWKRAAALEAATVAIGLEPDEPAWYLTLGSIHLARRRPAEAEAAFREALAIDPGSTDARNNLGVALLRLDRPDDALAVLGGLAAEHPGDGLISENALLAARLLVAAPHTRLAKAFKASTLPGTIRFTGPIALVLGPAVLITRHRRFRRLPPDLQAALRARRRRRLTLLATRPWRALFDDFAYFWPRFVAAARSGDPLPLFLNAMALLASALWVTMAIILALFLLGAAVAGIVFLIGTA